MLESSYFLPISDVYSKHAFLSNIPNEFKSSIDLIYPVVELLNYSKGQKVVCTSLRNDFSVRNKGVLSTTSSTVGKDIIHSLTLLLKMRKENGK